MPPVSPSSHAAAPSLEALHPRLWRGCSLGATVEPTLPSGFAPLDAELPGGGWPLRAVTELLGGPSGVLEWRLLAPALRRWWDDPGSSAGATPHRKQAPPTHRRLLLVNPPHMPHLPGLQALGLPTSALIWVSADTPVQQLWATEQAIRSRVAVLAWLPEARPEQIRRLQVCALGSEAPMFLMRPDQARHQSSAAPLRLLVQPGEGWELAVQLIKRRGPAHEGWLALPATPDAVAPLLTTARRHAVPPSMPAPAPAPTERPHALARPVLHA